MIEMLKADIQQYEADAELLTKEIGVHQEDLAVLSGDMKAAMKAREIEKIDYDATHKDYSESIEVLKEQNYDRGQASLTQVSDLKKLSMIPEKAKRAIDVFLAQNEQEGLATSAPEANAYEFQSQGIIDLLQKLLDKFEDERVQLEKEETSKRHSFEMFVQDLTNQEAFGKEAIETKSVTKAKKLQKKADAEGTLQDTTTTRDDDLKYLDDLVATCQKKSGDFKKRQELRAEEIEAIEKAIEIISGDAVQGNAEKHLPGLLQKKKVVLAQLRSKGRNPNQERAAQYLKERAEELDSRVLSAIAVRANDPFEKVRKMIKDLITRLEEEAAEEADHKAWCDEELGTNAETRTEKTDEVESLHAQIDQLEASIAKLTEDISELTTAVAEIDAAVAKATSIREEEKTKNSETIKDAQEAQEAVSQAITILKEFYAKAAESTVLVQKQPFEEAYKGQQAESGGVIAMLEVIQSDFARLESETDTAETTAQSEYDEFMTDSEADKTQKVKDIDHKSSKKQDQSQELSTAKTDLEETQKQLDTALAYYEKLKPSCVDAGVSYDDRVARRKEEIQSLQEALKILSGESI